nr:hypothetical protein [uncultured Flavobacterium sp.]
MQFSLSTKRTQLFKKYTLSALLLFVATFLEIYWAMGSFSEKISSGCLDCSFNKDVFIMCLITVFFLITAFLFLSLVKNRSLRNVIQWIFLNLVWLFWNYTVFVDRESSWSTYTFDEEIHFTIFYSILPILVLSSITIFVLDYISRSYASK